MKIGFPFSICHHLHLFRHPQITPLLVLANLMMLHIRLCYCLTTVQVLDAEPALSSWMRPPHHRLLPTSIAAWIMQRRRAPRHLSRHLLLGRCPAHSHLPRRRLVRPGRHRQPARLLGRRLLGRPPPPAPRRPRQLRVPVRPCHHRHHRHHHRLHLRCALIHAAVVGFIDPRSAPMAPLHGLPPALLKRRRIRLLHPDTTRLL